MSGMGGDPAGRRRMGRGGWLALVVGVAAVAAIVAWAVIASNAGGAPGASSGTTDSPGPTAASSASATPDPATGAPAAPSPSGDPTPGPLATIDPDPVVRETLAPVPLDEPVAATPEITVELVSIEPVIGVANIAGEVGGPALRVTVEATNSGGAAFATPAVIVNLYTGDDRAPAGMVLEPGSRQFPGSIAAGASASGVFIFTVPEDARDTILIEVDMQVGEPVVLFEGAVG